MVPDRDFERFRWGSPTGVNNLKPFQSRHRRVRQVPFLKGPVSMPWLRRAYALPGKALAVAIELQHLVGLRRSPSVRLGLKQFAELGISRYAAARGLRALEKAGLVIVERRHGRKPVVTVVEVDEPVPGSRSKERM